jgi:hypothetical protein
MAGRNGTKNVKPTPNAINSTGSSIGSDAKRSKHNTPRFHVCQMKLATLMVFV